MGSSGQPSRPRLGVALFGLGRAGAIHFHNVLRCENTRLLSVVEERVEEAEDMVARWYDDRGQPTVYPSSSITTVIQDDNVDIVIVATPTKTHEEIVIKSLEAGKHVFCEKPITESVEGTSHCYDVAASRGKHLFCAFNRRFDPAMSALHSRVRQGEVGEIHMMKSCSRDSPLPPIHFLRVSGGMFHDCLVHDIDLVCWVLGSRPVSVHALAHCHNHDISQLGDVDTIVVVMKFPSGILATIDVSRGSSYGYDQRVEVFGSKGMLSVCNAPKNEVVVAGVSGVTSATFKHSFPERYDEAYRLELEHFTSVVLGKTRDLIVTRDCTATSTRIASACQTSAQTGQSVILSWD